jgi:hypothetical protein
MPEPTKDPSHQARRRPVVALVGDDHPTARHRAPEALQHLRGHLAIVPIVSVYHHGPQQPQRVNDNMAFSPVDAVFSVIAALAAPTCRLDRLAIDDGETWGGLPASLQADDLAQRRVHAPDKPALLPSTEVVVDGLPGGELTWEHAPLAAGLQQVEDGVEDGASQVVLSLALVMEQGFDNFLLGVGQVGAIALVHGFGRSCGG